MTKITSLEAKTYQGKPQGFKVTLDDGRSGNLEEKQSDKGLRVGDEVFVTEIPYTSKAGNKSTLYGLRLASNTQPQAQGNTHADSPQRPAIHVGSGKSKEELKSEAAIRMAETVLKGFFAGNLDSGQVEPKQREYTTLLWSEIDDIFSRK